MPRKTTNKASIRSIKRLVRRLRNGEKKLVKKYLQKRNGCNPCEVCGQHTCLYIDINETEMTKPCFCNKKRWNEHKKIEQKVSTNFNNFNKL